MTTFEQYTAIQRITLFEPAPDGTAAYFVADTSGQFNLWRVPVDGGPAEQLTHFVNESVRDLLVSPDGTRIAFIADIAGNEKGQLYLMPARGGAPERVTNMPKVGHSLGAFSPDGRYIAYSANAAVPHDVDIYLRDLLTGEVRQLTPGGRLMYLGGAAFSPDGAHILAVQPLSNTDQNLWLIDVATGEARNLTEHPGRQVAFLPGPWRSDGKSFWLFSNDGRACKAAFTYDLESGRTEPVLAHEWDVERLAFSDSHGLLAYCINEAGTSRLRVTDRTTGRDVALPELPKGTIGGLAFAAGDQRRRLFLAMDCYNQANAVYVIDLERQELRLLTPAMKGHLPAGAFVSPEFVRIQSFDGLEIPAWLYRPQGGSPGVKVPVLLSIHGGPEIQERTDYRYSGFYQYLLSQGVAVLAPNIRGSTGFGIDWQKRIHRDWGGGDLLDMEACVRYLQAQDWVDGSKLAVWGRSYGGFAALSCAARLPQYWACAVDFCGPSNLVTFTRSVPPQWKPMVRAWIGDPDEDAELLTLRSPITYVDQIRCPLMVLQGAMDARVVQAESDQMVQRLRELGRPVEYVLFEDEGHELMKQSNQIKGYRLMAEFLLKHLG
jgi:dipeptidyl aminopeptidase/acylaminoacyl peptidase